MVPKGGCARKPRNPLLEPKHGALQTILVALSQPHLDADAGSAGVGRYGLIET
jgi:hypothetical protein